MWSTFFPRIVRKGLGANYRGFVFLVLISLLFPLLDKIAQAQQLSWVRQVGGSGQEAYGNSIGIDGSGNVYVTGAFSGTATFREGPSPIILTSSGDADIFVAKYGSDGTLAWPYKLAAQPTIMVLRSPSTAAATAT